MVSLLRIGNRRATPWSTLSISDPDIVVGYNWKSIRGNYKLALHELPDSLKFAFPIFVDGHFAFPFFSVEMRIDAEQGPLRNLHLAALMLRGLRYFYQEAYGKKRRSRQVRRRSDVNVFGHWTNSDPGDPNVTYEHFLIKKWHFEEMEELYVARHGLETLCKWIASGLQELAKA
ncbi:hypothetical protein ASPTUDRAFT_35624 [Aspergillus tubingensis CBS 134.48]|uniref:DUF7924 domain-containing protein n=1 Tax=Aspergillus tubingensis (strain CBS 134.48) TaxID=767770 RepID=A0A1L9NHN2_ASPTC|nr:hypothetical protein ASPTUDRAFT_35624 [Aspergillus tubingensis CBS 134.48]